MKDRTFLKVVCTLGVLLVAALGVAYEIKGMGAKAAPTPPPAARKAADPWAKYHGATYCAYTGPVTVACNNGYRGPA